MPSPTNVVMVELPRPCTIVLHTLCKYLKEHYRATQAEFSAGRRAEISQLYGLLVSHFAYPHRGGQQPLPHTPVYNNPPTSQWIKVQLYLFIYQRSYINKGQAW